MRNFRELRIWEDSVQFSVDIYKLLKGFPSEEKFGITRQISRCGVSIPSNIAEGCRGTNKELAHFLSISLGSAFELETQLEIAYKIGYVDSSHYKKLLHKLNKIQKSINSFRSKIKYENRT
jgi:four helix bundle protein